MDKLPPIDDATIRRTLERARAIFSKVDALRMETKTGSASELMTLMTGSSSEVPTKVSRALVYANNISFGYFIAQDSFFGNTILPVLPKIDSTAGIQSDYQKQTTSTNSNSFADNGSS